MPTGAPMSTTSRVFASDLETSSSQPCPPELETTKRAAEHAMLTAVPPAAVRRPSMYSSSGTVAGNVESRLATYGAPETLAYTLGRTVPLEDIKVPDRYMKTTNQQNYVEQPQVRTAGLGPSPTDYTKVACISYYQYLCTPNCADRGALPFLPHHPRSHFCPQAALDASASKPAGYFAPPAKTHFSDSTTVKAIYDTSHLSASEPTGSKGTRGEITRNPREAGNPYGVSVFVDEYARWQTKLAGMPLTESVGRAQTKYF